MAGWTNKGKFRVVQGWTRNTGSPTGFYAALITSAAVPGVDTNTFSELTEIAAGNGYTAGGLAVARNATDWDVLTEDDTNDVAFAQLKDMVWTGSGGNLPASGNGARRMILTDDNGTQASREVFHFLDLAADRTVSSGQALTIQNAEIRLTE
jgi:hypothetical protein